MAKLTEQQAKGFEYFDKAWDGFLMEHLGAVSREQYERAIAAHMTPLEKAAVSVNGFMQDFTASASSTRQARLIIGRNEIRMRALAKTFGVATLEDKLPDVAKNKEFADMARDLGGHKLALLIEHSLR